MISPLVKHAAVIANIKASPVQAVDIIFREIRNLDKKLENYSEELNKKIAELELAVLTVRKMEGPKGEKGDSGESIVGPQGIAGKDGNDGKDGTNGINGKDGRDGLNGKDGINGIDGKSIIGLPGKDAYV